MKRRIVGTIFIFIGLSIIGTALYMRYSADRRQKTMLQTFEKTLQELDTGNLPVNGSAILREGISGEVSAQINQSTPNVRPNSQDIKAMAVMVIPKINLTVAVAEGTDEETLKYAVGHFEGTALPGGKGNFAVAGHRSYTYSEYFNRADELQPGDEIIVRTKNGEFTYIVYEQRVVEPTEISVLDSTKGATITLVTCTPIRVATHRLIIKGKLKD
jgi:sortase A